ncbi:hypothetical protein G7K_3001-t4 [Saitoella complicata NRRL Y-17804]|uniref:Mitochondrial carrier n=1 Tax=Saitoella complicata (strain BCRC 22490 / CBS 7301 / JCM 7358 / NBRC 10748 / NRRL Y-17804) TaxID=698492 RepID=A0A0E9NG60_SAICN|nr:hypothetical protein G7K_3001-t4 [Saitoella complicata NRRL Y-17804]
MPSLQEKAQAAAANDPLVSATSGAVGSAIANALVYPLDVIVSRLQTQNEKGTFVDDPAAYSGLVDALVRIYKEESLSAFFLGLKVDTLSVVSSTFFYHFAYTYMRTNRLQSRSKVVSKTVSTLGPAEELAIGAIAGIISRFFTTPLQNVVKRKQTVAITSQIRSIERSLGDQPVPTAMEILREIYSEKGITGLWTGYRSACVLTVNPSISYYAYEVLKSFAIPQDRRSNPTSKEIFLYSALAKSLATVLTYPLILTKSRAQVSSSKNANSVAMIRKVFKSEGLQGLYKGVGPQVLKGFFQQGLMMMIKDRVGSFIVAIYLLLRRVRGRNIAETAQNLASEAAQNKSVQVARQNAEAVAAKAKEAGQTVDQYLTNSGAKDKAAELAGKAKGSIDSAYTKVAEVVRDADIPSKALEVKENVAKAYADSGAKELVGRAGAKADEMLAKTGIKEQAASLQGVAGTRWKESGAGEKVGQLLENAARAVPGRETTNQNEAYENVKAMAGELAEKTKGAASGLTQQVELPKAENVGKIVETAKAGAQGVASKAQDCSVNGAVGGSSAKERSKSFFLVMAQRAGVLQRFLDKRERMYDIEEKREEMDHPRKKAADQGYTRSSCFGLDAQPLVPHRPCCTTSYPTSGNTWRHTITYRFDRYVLTTWTIALASSPRSRL